MTKIRNGTETWFAYDESGRLLGSNFVSAKDKGQQEIIWLDDLPVGALQGKTLYPIEADHLGSPRKVIDPASNQAIWDWPILDNPFGETQPNQNPDGNTQTFTLNLRFPGQQYDPETGLYYNYFRDYEPGTGRYLESDPLGLTAGPDPYLYVRGNPLRAYDPKGLVEWNGTQVQLGAAVVFGGAVTRYDLKTECVHGKKGRATVYAVGPVVGIEVEYGPPGGLTASDLTFNDELTDVDPNVFNGWYVSYGAGAAVGIGYSCQAIQLGGDGFHGGAFSIGCGKQAGLDASLATNAGSATVIDSAVETCSCDDQK